MNIYIYLAPCITNTRVLVVSLYAHPFLYVYTFAIVLFCIFFYIFYEPIVAYIYIYISLCVVKNGRTGVLLGSRKPHWYYMIGVTLLVCILPITVVKEELHTPDRCIPRDRVKFERGFALRAPTGTHGDYKRKVHIRSCFSTCAFVAVSASDGAVLPFIFAFNIFV